MKKLGILVITLAVLCVGFAMADPGMKPVPETQGISTFTIVDGVGNLETSTELSIEITNRQDLGEVPPLDDGVDGSTYYAAGYSEDTGNELAGSVEYTKELDVETDAVGAGLSNVKTNKIIMYEGTSVASRITSDEDIFVDGAGIAYAGTDSPSLCPFSGATTDEGSSNPAFCNFAGAGSYIDMSYANVRTSADTRFIIDEADDMVELNYDIEVFPKEGVPSYGGASAYLDVTIREGRNDADDKTGMFEEIEYYDSTSVFGYIFDFSKDMHYESAPTR